MVKLKKRYFIKTTSLLNSFRKTVTYTFDIYYLYSSKKSKMKYLISFLLIFITIITFSQEKESVSIVNGIVLDQKTKLPMQGVSVINLNQLKMTSTNVMGAFRLEAKLNDTLNFSFIGYDPSKVRVTNDWINTKMTTIELMERVAVIEGIEITGITLTGFLDVDTKLIPVGNDYRYSISGLYHGYEAGKRNTTFSKIMRSIHNPVDALYNTFGKKPRELAKLREIKKEPTVKELLASKFDRETLVALLGVSKKEIEEILTICNYSETFIKTANDLQILDAINECYEEYKLINRK